GELGEGDRDRAWITLLGRPLDDRTAREAEPKELRHFVEGLASGVVSGLPDQAVLARLLRVVERRVATGDNEREKRVLGRIVGEERGVDVTLEVVHADQRLPMHPGEGLGH